MHDVSVRTAQTLYLLITKLVVVNDEGKVLTMRRSKDAPRRPWTWDFPGGIVEDGEQPIDAVLREAAEESGLTFTAEDVMPIQTVIHPRGDEQAAIVFYLAHHRGDEITLSHEHDSYEWVTKQEFQNLETPDTFKQIVVGL